MRPYSMDLRGRVVAACDRGGRSRERVAEEFGVSAAWIPRLLQRRRETGSIATIGHRKGFACRDTSGLPRLPPRMRLLRYVKTQNAPVATTRIISRC